MNVPGRTQDRVNWDAERYGDSVKVSQPNRDGLPTPEPERMRKYYPEADLGKISAPATIVDMHGRILTIYLPNILSSSRVVRSLQGTTPTLLIRVLGVCQHSNKRPPNPASSVHSISNDVQNSSLEIDWLLCARRWRRIWDGKNNCITCIFHAEARGNYIYFSLRIVLV